MSRVGCLILAGGQGTRLGHAGPKGTFEIQGRSLFSRIAERARGPVAVMTSPLNDAQTRDFFEKNHNFGIGDLSFVVQEMLPFLDEEHKPLPQQGPAGNGWALKHLVDQWVVDVWEARGIEAVNTVQIDNLLANPHDEELVACGVDVAMRGVLRLCPEEKVGVVVQGPRIVPYAGLNDDLRNLEKYPLADSGIFCFSMPFVREAARRASEMAIHLARKPAPGGDLAFKQERFLFDCLSWARTSQVIVSERNACFFPIKSDEDVIAANVLLG